MVLWLDRLGYLLYTAGYPRMSDRLGLNVSDARLLERQEAEALRVRNELPVYESLDYARVPFWDRVKPDVWYCYTDETAALNGWPKGGRVRFVASCWETEAPEDLPNAS